MNVTWSNSLGKVDFFFSLYEIQILRATYMSCLGKAFESLRNKIQVFADLKISGVSSFLFCAIEPI